MCTGKEYAHVSIHTFGRGIKEDPVKLQVQSWGELLVSPLACMLEDYVSEAGA